MHVGLVSCFCPGGTQVFSFVELILSCFTFSTPYACFIIFLLFVLFFFTHCPAHNRGSLSFYQQKCDLGYAFEWPRIHFLGFHLVRGANVFATIFIWRKTLLLCPFMGISFCNCISKKDWHAFVYICENVIISHQNDIQTLSVFCLWILVWNPTIVMAQ